MNADISTADLESRLEQYATDAVFQNGLQIHFRPIYPADADLLREFFYSHSEQTIVHRYFAHIHQLSAEQIRKFVMLDYRNNFALIGVIPRAGGERMICVGRYCRNPAGRDAEIAITVHDDFQHRGIGTFLVRSLAEIALENGISVFTASVLADNQDMMRVFHKVARKIEVILETDVYQVRFELGGGNLTKNGESSASRVEPKNNRRIK